MKRLRYGNFYITVDEKQVIENDLDQLYFISQNYGSRSYTSENHKVFKDYILSSEAYTLPSSFESAS